MGELRIGDIYARHRARQSGGASGTGSAERRAHNEEAWASDPHPRGSWRDDCADQSTGEDESVSVCPASAEHEEINAAVAWLEEWLKSDCQQPPPFVLRPGVKVVDARKSVAGAVRDWRRCGSAVVSGAGTNSVVDTTRRARAQDIMDLYGHLAGTTGAGGALRRGSHA